MNIAFFLPDLNGGGAERAAILLARHWPPVSAQPVLILRASSGHYLADAQDLELVHLGLDKVGLVATVRTPWALARVARARELDMIVTFLTVPSAVATRLLTRRLRVVWDVQNPQWRGDRNSSSWNSPARMLATRLAIRGLSAVILPSKGLELDEQLASFSGPVLHIPNPVDPALFAAASHQVDSGGQDRPAELVAVGRLVRQKRFDLLLEAVGLLKDIGPIQLTIYGEGPERADLELQRNRLGLQDIVRFGGFEKDISRIYRGAAALVLSSDFEGFGNVIVEALAFGLAVVATDAPYGPRDILAGGRFGVLVPPGSAVSLAAGIRSVLPGGENHDRLSRSAVDRAREYAAPIVAARMREALEEVTQRGGHRNAPAT